MAGKGQKSSQNVGIDFASIYEKWTKSHNENAEIAKRAKEPTNVEGSSSSYPSSSSIKAIRSMKAQAVLDLHNYVLEEALVRVRIFLDNSRTKGFRKVLVITGKGIHSAGGESVLRPAIKTAIVNHSAVRETFVPKASEGGSGAIAVILKA